MTHLPIHRQHEQYARRRTGLRRLLALALAVTAAAVGVAFWSALHHKSDFNGVRANLPQNVNRRSSGYDYTRWEGPRKIFSIHAARTLAYNQGSSALLEDVHVVIFGRKGNRHDEIQAARCRYDPEPGSGAMTCYGSASIVLESRRREVLKKASARPPVIVHTSDVSYDPRHSLVETSRAVRFQYGASSGAGVGLAYDAQSGSLNLKREVTLNLRPNSGLPLRVIAGGLLYRKQTGQISLRSPVELSQAGRCVTSATGTLYLNSDGQATKAVLAGGVKGAAKLAGGNFHGTAQTVIAFIQPRTSQVEKLDAGGSVQLAIRSSLNGDIRRVSAQHVLLNFSAGTAEPQSGVASGDVQVVSEAAPDALPLPRAGRMPAIRQSGRPGAQSSAEPVSGNLGADGKRILAAHEITFQFRSGRILESASTVGPGEIHLVPLEPARPRSNITAGKLVMAFDSQGRLKTIQGLSGSRMVSQPGPDAPRGRLSETATADHLRASLDPATGRIKTLRQTGNFQFWQGDRHASAQTALYLGGSQQLTLTGHPVIWNADSRIRAKYVEIGLSNGKAKGWGGVQSTHFDPSTPPGQRQVSPRARSEAPPIPLVVVADQVIANKASQFVRYEGNVKAWHGPDVIEATSLDIDKKQERVSSGLGVVTSLVQAEDSHSNSAANSARIAGRAAQPLIVRADRLVYLSLGKEAVYTGHVQANSGDTTLRAKRLEAWFSKADRDNEPMVTRVAADGNVTATQSTGRRAAGQHAGYFPGSGKVVLTGGPPIIYDAKQGFLTARRLTFFTHDASLIADGGRKAQALSKYRVSSQ